METVLLTPAKRTKEILRSALDSRRWSLQRLCGLHPAHCRNQIVTPYFFCLHARPAIGARGVISIDGPIGIIHQGFEQAWTKSVGRPDPKAGLCTSLLIINLPQLRKSSY